MWLTIAQIMLAVMSVGWIILHGLGVWSLRRAPRLQPEPKPESESDQPAHWPTLAVIIPACNEAATLSSALASVLAQDYPALQIILVNDRSSDDTGAIAQALADTDTRLRVLHVHELPEGWLGKVHALQAGLQVSASDYVLFTDADVRFAPGALRAAMSAMLTHELDHLTLLPKLIETTFAQKVFMQAFFVGFIRRLLGAKTVTASTATSGIGAFNLFKRGTLARTEGLPWLCMDVVDDLALAALLKKHGARSGVAIADQYLSIIWYDSIGAVIKGLRKNSFGALAAYRYSTVIAFVVLLPVLMLAPVLCLLSGMWWYQAAGALALLALTLEAWAAKKYWGLAFGAGLCVPLANLPLLIALIWSASLAWRDGGIYWRERFYPLAALKAGRRVRFP